MKRRRKQLLNHLRYEVQVLTGYGWGSAGNFSARTLKEGMASLEECAKGINRRGDSRDFRLVQLSTTVIAVRKATMKWNEQEQRYDPIIPKGKS